MLIKNFEICVYSIDVNITALKEDTFEPTTTNPLLCLFLYYRQLRIIMARYYESERALLMPVLRFVCVEGAQ